MSSSSSPAAPTAGVAATKPFIAVFGASWAVPGGALYTESERLGALIHARGYHVCSGGYSGTMEGVSKGFSASAASAGAGGEAICRGCTVPLIFPRRGEGARSEHGNEYLTERCPSATLLTRIDAIVASARFFVVMNGTLGTLAELAIVWNIATLAQYSDARPPFIVAYRAPWERLLRDVSAALALPPSMLEHVRFVDSAAEALDLIDAERGARADSSAAASCAAAEGAEGGAGAVPSSGR